MLEEETDLREVHDTLKILVSVSYKAEFRLYLSDTESVMPETAGQTGVISLKDSSPKIRGLSRRLWLVRQCKMEGHCYLRHGSSMGKTCGFAARV